MALKLNSHAQLVFFSEVFNPHHAVVEKAKALVSTGTTFEVSLYGVTAQKDGTTAGVLTLTASSTSLMKGTVGGAIAAQNRNLITGWVEGLWEKQGKPSIVHTHTVASEPVKPVVEAVPTTVTVLGVLANNPKPNLIPLIKAIRTVTGEGLATAKDKAEKVLACVNVSLATFPSLEAAEAAAQPLKALWVGVELKPVPVGVWTPQDYASVKVVPAPKPVDAVIDLKDAAALGQKVHGTSTGSVYHTIALTEHVKVAARLKGNAISIRTEWTDNPTADLKKLEDVGVQMKPHYGSIHFDAADVPVQKVIGAFLFGTGINWKAVVTTGAELVIG